MRIRAAMRCSSCWRGNLTVRSAPNCEARATASGGASRRAPVKTPASSGSAIQARRRSCSANPRLTRSVASNSTRQARMHDFEGLPLHLDSGSSSGRALAGPAAGPWLPDLLRLRRRRARRDGQSPDNHPPSLDPTPAALRARLERRPHRPEQITLRHRLVATTSPCPSRTRSSTTSNCAPPGYLERRPPGSIHQSSVENHVGPCKN